MTAHAMKRKKDRPARRGLTLLLAMILCLACTGTAQGEGEALTIFSQVADTEISQHGDVLSMQELSRVTGVDVEWVHPPRGQEKEQFNLMVVSQDLTDIIYYNWADYSGGPEKAILDEVILPLNDYIDAYAPNLKAFFEANPEAKRQATTDDGTIYMFPFVRDVCLSEETMGLNFTQGPIYRLDWAEQLGIDPPQTIEDWYEMLCAFRDNDMNGNGDPNDEIPFSGVWTSTAQYSINYFCAAFGVLQGFYLEDGKVNHSILSPKYKEYLDTMRQWYAEGLIDPDYLAIDSNTFQAKVTSGLVGSWIGSETAHYVNYAQVMEETLPQAQIKAIPWPMTKDGNRYTAQPAVNAICNGKGFAISSACKDIEAAMRYLDYIYSEEGIRLVNYGIEGEHYVLDEEGNVVWTEEMQAQIDEKGFRGAVIPVAFGGRSGYIYQDTQLAMMAKTDPAQMEAVETWGQASADLIVPTLTPTMEESATFADIMSQVNTYLDEMVGKYIMGLIDTAEYDTMVENCKKMGIEQALGIENAAYARYLAR